MPVRGARIAIAENSFCVRHENRGRDWRPRLVSGTAIAAIAASLHYMFTTRNAGDTGLAAAIAAGGATTVKPNSAAASCNHSHR